MTPTEEALAHAERIGLADAKADLSSIVSRVELQGTPYVITRYNRPVAMLVSVPRTAPRTTKARGMLAPYADGRRRSLEEGAFLRAMREKHGDAS